MCVCVCVCVNVCVNVCLSACVCLWNTKAMCLILMGDYLICMVYHVKYFLRTCMCDCNIYMYMITLVYLMHCIHSHVSMVLVLLVGHHGLRR